MRLLQLPLRHVLALQDIERKHYDDNDVDHGEPEDAKGGLIVVVENDVLSCRFGGPSRRQLRVQSDMVVCISVRHANWTEKVASLLSRGTSLTRQSLHRQFQS